VRRRLISSSTGPQYLSETGALLVCKRRSLVYEFADGPCKFKIDGALVVGAGGRIVRRRLVCWAVSHMRLATKIPGWGQDREVTVRKSSRSSWVEPPKADAERPPAQWARRASLVRC
jgi:hypothetical protein